MPTVECRSVRESLLDFALARGDARSLSRDLSEHLGRCPGCAKYLEGLRAAPGLFQEEPLYTPALRRRTLNAVADATAARPCRLAPLVVPASALSVAMSVAAPVWLLTLLVRPLLGSEWLSLGFALALTISTGLVISGVGLSLLTQRRMPGLAPAPNGALFTEVHHE
jgi:hypothetical protein